MRQHRTAFSLVELSIVLVILGLLVGGILAGQSLIHASELRAVGTEYQRYSTAVSAFRDKYFALPGDMANATSFWGAAAACPGTNSQPSTTATTCNGDGNSQLSTAPGAGLGNEEFRFWQQLANAGLITGVYAGVEGTGGVGHSVIGFNVPASKYPQGGWSVTNWATSSSGSWFWANYGNHFNFGAAASTIYRTENPLFNPDDAWNIDTKLDDGMPATGKFRPRLPCTNAANGGVTTATYLLGTTATTCAFRILF